MQRKSGPSLIGIIYLILGIVIAANHGYLTGLGSVSSILTAGIAIILWPALLVGANLHLTLGL